MACILSDFALGPETRSKESMEAPIPQVALMGGGADELELLADLHAQQVVEVVGVFDPDPHAPALDLAQILGIAAGSSAEFRHRLATATHRVLPSDPRRAAAIEAETFPGETLRLDAAWRRWGGGTPVPQPAASASQRAAALATSVPIETRRELPALADWLLDQAIRAVGGNGGSLQRLTGATGELYILAARGLSERLVRHGRHRLGSEIAGTVAATRASRLQQGPKPGRVARERGAIASAISVPLEDAAGVFGVLNVSTTLAHRPFDTAHVHALEQLAPRIVALLRACEADEAAAGDDAMTFSRVVRELSNTGTGFDLAPLCETLRQRLEADGLRLVLATEDATWRILLTAGTLQSSPPPQRDRMSRAMIEDCWLHAPESPSGDAAMEPAPESGCSRVYAPLSGLQPVGVLVLEFGSLRAAEAGLRRGRALIAPLGLAVEAVVRDRAQQSRIDRFATLAHFPRVWRLEANNLLATLAQQAAMLVGARVASVRRCDEIARVYSRPALHGIDAEAIPTWRRFDLQVTEHTLAARRAVLTIAAPDERDPLTGSPPRRSLISVPLQFETRIVGIVNVYDRVPGHPADADVFTGADREILEALASLAAPFVAVATDTMSEAANATESPAPDAAAVPVPTDPVPTDPVAIVPAASLPDATAPTPHDEPAAAPENSITARVAALLRRTPAQSLDIVVLRFSGLSRVESTLAADFRDQCVLRAGACLQDEDACGWSESENLVLASMDPQVDPHALAERALTAIRPALARLPEGVDFDVRIGTSRAPHDAGSANALIELASERTNDPAG